MTVNLRDQNGDVLLRKQVSTRPAKVIRFFEELTACCAASGCGFWAIVEVCGFIERSKRPRALANYFGLTPGCRNSGEKKDRLGRITKAGSSMTRWVLGQASKHILRTDPAMRAWFKKLKRKRGSKIARVAVMRRMATIIWHMLTKRKTWAEVRSLGIGLQT